MKEREKQMDQEMTYTVTTPDGITDYFYADTMWDAFQEALAEYGQGITIRPSWYGETDCGTEELVKKRGYGCYHDAYGVHHRIEKVDA